MLGMIKKLISLPLHWQILIAMTLGLLVGQVFKSYLIPVDGEAMAMVPETIRTLSETMGTVFLRLLRMVIVPLVVSSIIVGVAGAGDPKNLGRLGARTFGYYMLSSLVAIMIGLTLSNVIRPGEGVVMPEADQIDADSLQKPDSVGDLLTRIIPMNPVDALADADMLSIIFFCLCFGAAMTQVKEEIRAPLMKIMDAIFQTMMKLTGGVIRLAPLGVYGLIFTSVLRFDSSFVVNLAKYFATIAFGLSIHLLVGIPILFYVFTRRSPIKQFKDMAPAMMTAFSTSSSSATLPVTMECLEENVKVPNRISSFVLPMGATINMDGTALFECVGALFIAQIMGADLSMGQQMIVVLTALLASIGAATVPSAGLVVIFIVLDAVGLRGEQVGFIVGAMLAIDRPLDMYRTVVNIFSDSVGATIVAHAENELPEQQ